MVLGFVSYRSSPRYLRYLCLAPWIPTLLAPLLLGCLAASLPGSLARWLPDSFMAPWLLGVLAPGRPEMAPRDFPDPRTWFPGLAKGRPEMVPYEDPADPGSGGQKRTGLQPLSCLGEGGGAGVRARRGNFPDPPLHSKAKALNL